MQGINCGTGRSLNQMTTVPTVMMSKKHGQENTKHLQDRDTELAPRGQEDLVGERSRQGTKAE